MQDSKYQTEELKHQRDQNAPFDDDLQEIPYYMRERVAAIIESKVEQQVRATMDQFKEEVMRELEDQRIQNQMHISHYLDHPYHYGKYHHPYAYGPRYSMSKSPVRKGTSRDYGSPSDFSNGDLRKRTGSPPREDAPNDVKH